MKVPDVLFTIYYSLFTFHGTIIFEGLRKMQIVEVKNNLVKISYDTSQESLVLSGFVVVNDPNLSFIAQIIHLEANQEETFAVVKLLFTFDSSGVIKNYNGAIPDVKSFVNAIQPQELLGLLPVKNPVVVGELAQQQTILKLDRNLFEEKLLVCSEKDSDNEVLIKNFVSQLFYENRKILVIDLDNTFELSQNKIVAGDNFKLPLNYETMNFIYNELEGASAQTKALIQEVLLEVQNYVKTLNEGFLPFDTFKEVVDEQYKELNLVELVLLKNKLLKFQEAGIFAQSKEEFDFLKTSLEDEAPTILDLSGMDDKIQKEIISYTYSLINSLDKEIYIFLKINNTNSDKKLLKQIFSSKKACSTIICPYSYKYLRELKQLAGNLILFAPIQQQEDFASYNAFLKKLNNQEFVIYGNATHHLPLIVKLDETPQNMFGDQAEQEVQAEPQENKETIEEIYEQALDEEIKKDVDEIYTTPKSEKIVRETETVAEPELIEEEFPPESFTDDDLDFIETLVDESEPSINEEETHAEQEEESQVEDSVEIIEEDDKKWENIEEFKEEAEEEVLPVEPEDEILPVSMASTPIVPIYSAEVEPKAHSDELEQGDTVVHPKYGKGTVEKLITYGSKTLCSIHFDNVGRRLLDPSLAEIKKV